MIEFIAKVIFTIFLFLIFVMAIIVELTISGNKEQVGEVISGFVNTIYGIWNIPYISRLDKSHVEK